MEGATVNGVLCGGMMTLFPLPLNTHLCIKFLSKAV